MLPVITFIPTIKNVLGIGGFCYPGIPVTCRNIGSSKSKKLLYFNSYLPGKLSGAKSLPFCPNTWGIRLSNTYQS